MIGGPWTPRTIHMMSHLATCFLKKKRVTCCVSVVMVIASHTLWAITTWNPKKGFDLHSFTSNIAWFQPNLAGRRQFFVGSREKWNPAGNFGRFPISEPGREQRKLETELEQKISCFMRGIVEKSRSVPFQTRHFSTKLFHRNSCCSVFLIWETENHTWFHGAGYFSAVLVFRYPVD